MRLIAFFKRYLNGSGKLLGAMVVLALLDQGASLYAVYLWKEIIDDYLLRVNELPRERFVLGISLLILGWIGLAMVSRIAKNIQEFRAKVVADRTSLNFFERAYAHVISLSLEFHAGHQTGALLRQLGKARDDMNKIIVASFDVVVTQVTSFVLVTGFFFYIRWQVGIVMLMFLPLFLGVTRIFAKNIERVQKHINDEMEKLHGSVQQALDSFQMVLSFHSQETEIARLDENHRITHACLREKTVAFQKLAFWQGTLINLTRVSIIGSGAYFVYTGQMTVGEVVLLSTWAYSIYWPMYQISDLYAQFTEGFESIARVERLLQVQPTIANPAQPRTPARIQGHVRFNGVSYRYPNQPMHVVEDIDFEVLPGQQVAIVGPSGSGKSTLTKLLPRFFDATQGLVSIDGVDVRDWELNRLRDTIGIVLQETQLFHTTVRENILYGNVGRSQAEIEAAAVMTHAHDFIMKLPQGYDTVVGERGIKLSGGEKQRVSLARTILRNPAVLILDEATSSLDSESEITVMRALLEVSRNRTTLMVAHRLSTVHHCDQILFCEAGRIVERGNHDQLMALGGRYAAYVQLQRREESI